MKIDIETLRKTKGIGEKTLERIVEQHHIDNGNKKFKSKYIPSDTYKIDKDINLWHGNCLELMNHIPDKSIDMILADLPYGTMQCTWDEVIPFEPLWSHYKRIIKDNGTIVLFGSEPFSTKLRMSNLGWYRYDWIWDKKNIGNPFLAKFQPLKQHEIISVFYNEGGAYNPQMTKRKKSRVYKDKYGGGEAFGKSGTGDKKYVLNAKYPKSIIEFSNTTQKGKKHPTQKPVGLLEYLIRTYTSEGMLVLDNVMGSGSTGVACKNLDRRFVGIELEEKYFNIAKERINKV